jgi:LacI family transcriptional regulator
MRTTLRQVAESAGCSVTAASKVLNAARGTAGVGAATRRRVERAARRLGYRPNQVAAALRKGRSGAIGLLLGRPGDYGFYGQLIAGINRVAAGQDRSLLIVGAHDTAAAIEEAKRALSESRIDALIVPSSVFRGEAKELDALDAPIVFYGRPLAGVANHPRVSVDLRPGIEQAVAHLAALGHRDLLWIHPTRDGRRVDADRIGALRDAAGRSGLALAELACPTEDGAGAESDAYVRAVRRRLAGHLARRPPATAVMAYNERCAAGACVALWNAGLRVPADVSVIGFDDIYARVATPPLTVVSIVMEAAGEAAARLALAMSRAPDRAGEWKGRHERIPTALVVRDSTAPTPRRGRRGA